jgi:ribosomal protein S18 acetylase RimI-like enzyme
MIGQRSRWRRVAPRDLEGVVARLTSWPAPRGGTVRHLFPLAAIETSGADVLRVTGELGGDGFAAVVLIDGHVVAPCGDPEAIRRAGSPLRRWRLLVGDRAAGDALLAASEDRTRTIVHDQALLVVDPDRVPAAAADGGAGLRRAEPADVDALARLAVRLHVDDGFGPDPGLAGLLGYRARVADAVRRGLSWCVGPVGAPIGKVERSVSSGRFGVQLAGIVVDPEHRGRGVGSGMVAAAVRDALAEGAPAVTLHVREDNGPALAAYRSAGFAHAEPWRLALRP